MNIYDLSTEFLNLQTMLEQGAETPEEEQAIVDALESVQGDLEAKCDGYARVVKNMAAEADAIKTEEKRLATRRKALENGVERLKSTIYNTMTLLGAKKVKTSIGTFSIQKNPWSVDVLDIQKVPARFLIEQQPTVDKKAILAEFKESGELFDGLEFKQTEGVRFR